MGAACPQLWSRGAVPSQLFIGLGAVVAAVLPVAKLGVVGKLNGRKDFSEQSPPVLARQLIWQINLYSRLSQRYFLHLAETE